ncbi:MAG: CAP domain-containing protein [Dehalococcoidia bacterium]|nr:CAP domain-containing protein [Dehalococcoidia bacterium]
MDGVRQAGRRAVPWLAGALAAAAAVAAMAAPRARALSNCTVAEATLDSEELNFVALLNGYRAANGLTALSVSANLERSATWLAGDMATRGYFDHRDGLGRDASARASDCGYPGGAGENIAAGSVWASGRDAFEAWRTSPGHNANMLNGDYRQVGVARVYAGGSQYGWYWVADFGLVNDGTTAELAYSGPESGVRASDLRPGAWNVARVLPGGLRVSDLQGWTAWDQLPNGWWQQWGPGDFIPGGTTIGLLPTGLSLDHGRTAR